MSFLKRRSSLLFLLTLLMAGPLWAEKVAILSLGYISNSPNIYYGTTMTVVMAAAPVDDSYILAANGRFQVTGQNATDTTLELSSAALNGVTASTQVYISDGTRTWMVPATGGTVIVNNGNLVTTSLPLSSYANLNAQTLYAYSSGTTATSGTLGDITTAGSATVAIDILDTVALNPVAVSGGASGAVEWRYDNYIIHASGVNISNGHLYGKIAVPGQLQSIDEGSTGFQSTQSFNIDTTIPTFSAVVESVVRDQTINPSTLMYISSESNNTSNPSWLTLTARNTQALFQVTVSKPNCVVSGTIVAESSALPFFARTLPVVVLGDSTNGKIYWDGKDGSGQYASDGKYDVTLTIQDANGVVGPVSYNVIQVTSLHMDIINKQLLPGTLPLLPAINNGHLTSLNYDVILCNDSCIQSNPTASSDKADITAAMAALGWNSPLNTYGNYHSFVFATCNVNQVDASGNFVAQVKAQDSLPNDDLDQDLLIQYSVYPNPAEFSGPYVRDPNFVIPAGDFGIPPGPLGIDVCNPTALQTAGIAGTAQTAANAGVFQGDGDKGNDWDDLRSFMVIKSNGTGKPVFLSEHFGVNISGSTPATPSTYQFQIYAYLTGMAVGMPNGKIFPPATNLVDPCNAAAAAWFRSLPIHFSPSIKHETDDALVQGDGIIGVEPDLAVLQFSQNSAPATDSTPPFLVSSSPANASQVAPYNYGPLPNSPLQIILEDDESAIDPQSCKVTVTLVSNGKTATVPGSLGVSQGSSNASQRVLSFYPSNILILGGVYTVNYFASSLGGSISGSVSFQLRDTATPQVSSAWVVPSAGSAAVQIYQANVITVPNGCSQVWAMLSMPYTSSNTILWGSCSLHLIPLVNGVAQAELPLTRISTGTPTDNILRYQVISPIYTSGTYKLVVITYSQDILGNIYGPDNSTSPFQFNVQASNNILNIFQIDPYNNADQNLALQITLPVTVTASTGQITDPTQLVAGWPTSLVAAPTGFAYLTHNANTAYGLQFFQGTTALQSLQFVSLSSTVMNLWYYGTDMPSGVSQTSLVVKGYHAGTWTDLGSWGSGSNTGNSGLNNLTYHLASNNVLADYLAIFYPTVANTSSASTFKSTRSFNPTSGSSLHNQALLFLGTKPVSTVDIKVFSMAGVVVRKFSKTVSTQVQLDMSGKSNWYYTWDGRNNDGDVVNNGIYMAIAQVHFQDGTSNTLKNILAVIK